MQKAPGYAYPEAGRSVYSVLLLSAPRVSLIGFADRVRPHIRGVHLRRREIRMSQHRLDHPHIGSVAQKMGRERVEIKA